MKHILQATSFQPWVCVAWLRNITAARGNQWEGKCCCLNSRHMATHSSSKSPLSGQHLPPPVAVLPRPPLWLPGEPPVQPGQLPGPQPALPPPSQTLSRQPVTTEGSGQSHRNKQANMRTSGTIQLCPRCFSHTSLCALTELSTSADERVVPNKPTAAGSSCM